METKTISNAARINVQHALQEDVGSGDITAALISETKTANARVITRDSGIACGSEWVNEVFKQVAPDIKINWLVQDGDQLLSGDALFTLEGSARGILTGERCALNFYQTLSGTATTSRHYADLVAHTSVKLLDTRKTLPGLRIAQKYAVSCGGCHNHRIGLYDAFLIKENHIIACGSIAEAVKRAHNIAPGKPVEVEVESINEFEEAVHAGADIIMLDNFDLEDLAYCVNAKTGQVKLEASGGVTHETLVPIAETGVDFISIGALTKDCKALDLSMRVTL